MLSRLQVLTSQPKLALGALLTLLLAATAVVGSGADFNATSANPANTFASGTLTIGNSKEGVAVLSASNLRPGEAAQTGTVDIENTGSLSGTFTLSQGHRVEHRRGQPAGRQAEPRRRRLRHLLGRHAAHLRRRRRRRPSTPARSPGMTTSSLGTYAAAAKHRYRFSVALDGTAGNAYQGDSLDGRSSTSTPPSRGRRARERPPWGWRAHGSEYAASDALRLARRSPLQRSPRCLCSPLR